MAGQPHPLEPEDVEQPDDVGGELRLQVAATRGVGPAEPAQVGADHPVALAERTDQPPPRIPVLRPAVDHHERLGVGRAGGGDVHAKTANIVEGVLDREAGDLGHAPVHVLQPIHVVPVQADEPSRPRNRISRSGRGIGTATTPSSPIRARSWASVDSWPRETTASGRRSGFGRSSRWRHRPRRSRRSRAGSGGRWAGATTCGRSAATRCTSRWRSSATAVLPRSNAPGTPCSRRRRSRRRSRSGSTPARSGCRRAVPGWSPSQPAAGSRSTLRDELVSRLAAAGLIAPRPAPVPAPPQRRPDPRRPRPAAGAGGPHGPAAAGGAVRSTGGHRDGTYVRCRPGGALPFRTPIPGCSLQRPGGCRIAAQMRRMKVV